MAEKLLFYDIEVFEKAYFAVMIDESGEVSQFLKLSGKDNDHYDNFSKAREKIKGYTLVGYNNYFYDDKILPLMLRGESTEKVKEKSDELINSGEIDTGILDNKTLDCIQQIDVSRPSLKKLEANMGRSVFESSIPFDKPDEFNEEEVKETFDYCTYDVKSTVEVYKLREGDYFKAKDFLISMLPDDDNLRAKAQRWNTTSIGGQVLLGKSHLDQWSEPHFIYEDKYENGKKVGKTTEAWNHPLYKEVPEEVVEMWKANKGQSMTIHNFDNDITFGFGGIHSVNTTSKVFENVTNIDVTSMYPNLIIKLNVLGSHTDKFKKLVAERVGHKKTNKPLAAAEKIIINSVYGLLDAEYSPFYNEWGANAIRFYGQCVLYKLAKELSPYVTIVQLNTDGMAFVINEGKENVVQAVYETWSRDQGLNLEPSHFRKFIQKDVNNYIGIKDDGSLKVKGKDVSRYGKDSFFRNNSTRIVDKALVNYFVNDISIEQTVKDNLEDPRLYQIVLQAGSTYEGTFDQNGKKYNKVNRVFAAKGDDTVKLLKKYPDSKTDKNGKPKNPVKYASAPDNMVVWNDSLNGIHEIPELDVDFYIELAKKALSNWTGLVETTPTVAKKKSFKRGKYVPTDEPVTELDSDDVETLNFHEIVRNVYIKKNLYVYPLAFGTSKPLRGTHGPKDAYNDNSILKYWENSQRNNVGMALGMNNLFILDLDVNHESGTDGIKSLNSYMKKNNLELPETYTERTPSGGYHYFFYNVNSEIKRNVVGLIDDDSGIDVQVEGTPVYPSVKRLSDGNFGQYIVDGQHDVAEAPDWLLALVTDYTMSKKKPKGKKTTKGKALEEVLNLRWIEVDEGGRNDAVHAYADKLAFLNVNPDFIATEIDTFNRNMVNPPLPNSEIKQIIKSVTKKKR